MNRRLNRIILFGVGIAFMLVISGMPRNWKNQSALALHQTRKYVNSLPQTKKKANIEITQNSMLSSVPPNFVGREGAQFVLNGDPFYFGGTNNYYLKYANKEDVRELLDDAQEMGLKVIRISGYIDGYSENVYFQSWNPYTERPEYNDGENGLEHLDYVIQQANERKLRLIIVLTNNWTPFGGMDQYVSWYKQHYHDDFYKNEDIIGAYQDWINHIVHRPNSYVDGLLYRDDPTIMAWEIANEPRCYGGDNENYPSSGNCTSNTITGWAETMANYVKTIDPNHLVAVGDEGWFNKYGVDFNALLAINSIDFGTFHLYPEAEGNTSEWGEQWIQDHIVAAHNQCKPVILEEFGWSNKSDRSGIYDRWLSTFYDFGGNGFMFWMLGRAPFESGDEDPYWIYKDEPIHQEAVATLFNWSGRMEQLSNEDGIDIALIIDSSSSMGNNDPLDLRKGAASIFIEAIDNHDQISVIDFDGSARVVWCLQPAAKNRRGPRESLVYIDSSGSTDIGDALRAGYTQLDNSTKISNQKAAVFLTDGDGYYSNEAKLYADRGWRVYTIGLGSGPNESLLQEIADETGGNYYALADPNMLNSVYIDILNSVTYADVLVDQSYYLQNNGREQISVSISEGQSIANFASLWSGSTVDMTLTDPDGEIIAPENLDQFPNISHWKGATYEQYRVNNPKSGEWLIDLFGADLPDAGENVIVKVSARNPIPPTLTPSPKPEQLTETPSLTPTRPTESTATYTPTPEQPTGTATYVTETPSATVENFTSTATSTLISPTITSTETPSITPSQTKSVPLHPSPNPNTGSGFGFGFILIVLALAGVGIYAYAHKKRQGTTGGGSVSAQLVGAGGAAYALLDGFTIGRSRSCQLHIPEPNISRQHAQIRLAQGDWFIQDQGSQLGTFVNGQRIQATKLNNGDQIRIGSQMFVFQKG